MNSNKVTFTLLAVMAFGYAAAQSPAKAIKWNENNPSELKVMDVNPSADFSESTLNTIRLNANRRYVANTMHHDIKNDLLYFFTDDVNSASPKLPMARQQKMVVADANTGERLRELPFFNSAVMAPFFIGERNELGFISVQRQFHGYGNNDDDISLVFFNLTTGEITAKVELPSLSFQAMSAPVVGKSKTTDFNGQTMTVEMSLSSPCYISSMEKLLFVAKDVLGNNRLFKVNTRTGKLESQLRVEQDVIDMVYDEENNLVRALFVAEEDGKRSLKLGNLDMNTSRITGSVEVRELLSIEELVTDGYVELDEESGDIFVGKSMATRHDMYTFDKDLQLVELKSRTTPNEKIDFEFPTKYTPSSYANLDNVISMFPNPTSGDVTILSELSNVTYVKVMNNVGEVVKTVDVQSEEIANEINVSNLAPGMYFVEIQSDAAEKLTKKLIVK
ncbi:MAG: T9SS type A sorting domain-containing protein [Bacteroidia bacterium]|nr:T9SS type A sorting domain-containing protein [Bacteroidia bacterium]